MPVKVGDLNVLVEPGPAAGPAFAPRVDAPVGQLEGAFTQAENTIAAIASSTVQAIQNAAERAARPDHVEVTFGLSFSADGSVIVAGASGQASLQVTLIYDGAPKADGHAGVVAGQASSPAAS
jgi:hypothetical protein